MHELAPDIPGFIWKITFPDLICICGLQELLEGLDRVLLSDPHSQLLSFNWVIFMFPHSFSVTLFSELPCVPAAFLLHKSLHTHRDLFKEVNSSIEKGKVSIHN